MAEKKKQFYELNDKRSVTKDFFVDDSGDDEMPLKNEDIKRMIQDPF